MVLHAFLNTGENTVLRRLPTLTHHRICPQGSAMLEELLHRCLQRSSVTRYSWQTAMQLALFARATHLISPAAKFVAATPHYREVFHQVGEVERV